MGRADGGRLRRLAREHASHSDRVGRLRRVGAAVHPGERVPGRLPGAAAGGQGDLRPRRRGDLRARERRRDRGPPVRRGRDRHRRLRPARRTAREALVRRRRPLRPRGRAPAPDRRHVEPARGAAALGIMPAVRRAALIAFVVALLTPPAAGAQSIPLPVPGGNLPTPPAITAPVFGPFRSVLAQGEGQSVSATDLAANQATGGVPETFTSQQPLYVGVMPAARTLVPGDLDTFYKRTDFGQMPGEVSSYTEPRPGARIFRDRGFGMAHIWGDTRYDLMFATGYAT